MVFANSTAGPSWRLTSAGTRPGFFLGPLLAPTEHARTQRAARPLERVQFAESPGAVLRLLRALDDALVNVRLQDAEGLLVSLDR
jgi:hypothetical protein